MGEFLTKAAKNAFPSLSHEYEHLSKLQLRLSV